MSQNKIIKWCKFLGYTAVACIAMSSIKIHSPLLGCEPNVEKEDMIYTIHGPVKIDHPLVAELIASPAMQRLKNIRQYGVSDYVIHNPTGYSRYEHSIGVYSLLKKHNCSLKEQVAGLLHDISHTVFSHSIDPLFMGGADKEAYQDQIHDRFLEKHGIAEILKKYDLSIEDVSPKQEEFFGLEQNLPDMCADRIEYNLFAAYMDQLLSPHEREEVVRSLHFDGKNWFFDDLAVAKSFSEVPLYESVTRWGSPGSVILSHITSYCFGYTLENKMLDLEDIEYNIDDDTMWDWLNRSEDPIIKSCLQKIYDYNTIFICTTQEDADFTIKSKFRGFDPLVKVGQDFCRLTELDEEFRDNYLEIKEMMSQGWHIKLVDKDPLLRAVFANYFPEH